MVQHPPTPEKHQCTVFLEGLPSHCPVAQGSSKAPESLQSVTLSSVHVGSNHSFRPAGPWREEEPHPTVILMTGHTHRQQGVISHQLVR